MTKAVATTEVERFRALVQELIRRFGLLVQSETPCGHTISVSHAPALMVLLEHRQAGNAASQTDLQRALGIDKSNVARMCARMEDAGHVRQLRAEHDGRSRVIALTDAGLKLAREVERASRKRFSELLRRVPAEDRAPVCEALDKLNAAVATAGTTKDET